MRVRRMSKPQALDLFCGAGGVTFGLMQAGYEVTGVDITPQPRYPGERFIQADVLDFPIIGDYDLIWANPPCQAYSCTKGLPKKGNRVYPELIAPVRQKILDAAPPTWCIENVPGAPMRQTLMLCGLMFGLKVLRHRIFETSHLIFAPHHPRHTGRLADGDYCSVYGHGGGFRGGPPGCKGIRGNTPQNNRVAAWREAMQIPWMIRRELAQAIPPAYSQFIGTALLKRG